MNRRECVLVLVMAFKNSSVQQFHLLKIPALKQRDSDALIRFILLKWVFMPDVVTEVIENTASRPF